MPQYGLAKLMSRIEFMRGKRVKLQDVSRIAKVHRNQLSKMLNGTGNVTTETLIRVAEGFFWELRKYDTKTTDAALFKLIMEDLLTGNAPARAFLPKREINRVAAENSSRFHDFPHGTDR